MTLRPRLTAGLPFRHLYYISSIQKGKCYVTNSKGVLSAYLRLFRQYNPDPCPDVTYYPLS